MSMPDQGLSTSMSGTLGAARPGRESLTTIERAALDIGRNLADAHARQHMTLAERQAILANFSSMFEHAREEPYEDLQLRAATAFLASLGQSPPRRTFFTLYASSIAAMVVARALKEAGRSVRLTSPTFDNIHDLLKAADVIVTPRIVDKESACEPPKPGLGCVFEVSPNNPTGHYLALSDLRKLASACAKTDTWLVLDQSFKGHDERSCFDHYQALEESGVSYILIEDTGKLWPTLDLKASFLMTSGDLVQTLEPIVDDVLLNVSPFILELVRRYSEFSLGDGYSSVRDLIATNREHLRSLIAGTERAIVLPYLDSRVGVEVLDLVGDRGLSPEQWQDRFNAEELGVLETSNFYWHEPGSHRTQLRISLCRDPAYFASGAQRLMSLVTK